MILIGLVAAILAGLALGAILRLLIRRISSLGTKTFGYYFSGVVFASALAFSPAFCLATRNFGQPVVFGMHSNEIFDISFNILFLLFVLYLFISRWAGLQRWNVFILLALSTTFTAEAIYTMQTYGGVHFNGLSKLIETVFIFIVIVVQLFMATVHYAFSANSRPNPKGSEPLNPVLMRRENHGVRLDS